MLSNYLEKMLELYKHTDAVLITDRNGFIEYSTMISSDIKNFKNAEVTGKHILEIYTSLTEETSTIMRVLRDGKPIIDEKQKVINDRGEIIYLINSTFPIEVNNEIIGAIEASVYADGNFENSNLHTIEIKANKNDKKLYTLNDIITNDHKVIDIKNKIRRIAVNNSSVLLIGETGTGKELFAQSIHSHSYRRDAPFISQNCAAIPNTLLESLLFGTVKGSYTGAENRKGLFEIANKGTLFLDEINSMDIAMQSKILKVLEEKQIRRIGQTDTIPIDVRIISAMNEEPLKAIEANKLREDLYFRIGVVQINIPPLRERAEDLIVLTEHFIKKYNHEMKRNINDISDLVKSLFNNYSWPGNVRELKNVIESSFNMAQSNIITMQDIPETMLHNRTKECDVYSMIGNLPISEIVDNYEKRIIIMAINESKNLVEAAKKLKISRQSLQYKLNKYDITNY